MILNHIEEEMTEFPEISEWDVINEIISQQYFKYYLYDEKMLSDNRFLETNRKYMNAYADNEEYYQLRILYSSSSLTHLDQLNSPIFFPPD